MKHNALNGDIREGVITIVCDVTKAYRILETILCGSRCNIHTE